MLQQNLVEENREQFQRIRQEARNENQRLRRASQRLIANVSLGPQNNIFPNISENYLGKMDVICIHCSAKPFKAEKVANKESSFY